MLVNGTIGDAMMADFEAAIRPGIREHELMAVLNESLFRHHGEFMFTRLIATGTNTNPWMSEAHDKLVQPGDLVGIDTDANGFEGYVIDFSRTFLCGRQGDGRPEGGVPHRLRLRERHARADEARHDVRGVLARRAASSRPSTAICATAGWPTRRGSKTRARAFPTSTRRRCRRAKAMPDRELQENMVWCLECYAGKEGAPYGVKLEDQILLTSDGALPLMTYPFEAKLL